MSAAYYDQTLTKESAAKLLKSLEAKKDARRSKATVYVYTIQGGGEAMVEEKAAKFRVRLFKGACPC